MKEYFSNYFVLGIAAFFLTSLAFLVAYFFRWRVQKETLKRVRANYLPLEERGESNPEIIRDDLLKGVRSDSLVAQRIKELYRISIHGGDFDQLALAEVLAAREGARTSIARYVSSVLVLLGLCGAIWGLSHLVFQMGPALRHVQEQLDSADLSRSSAGGELQDRTKPIQESLKTLVVTMSDSLVNTRTAFAASLTGIFASVLLLLANWGAARLQVEFLAELEDLTATRLIPIFKPPREASELAGIVESFKEGSGFLVGLSDDLGGKVSQVSTSLDELFAIVRKFSDSSESLRENQDLVYKAQEQMLGVVGQFVGLTTRIETHQNESGSKLDNVVAAVSESNRNISRAIDDWQGKHEKLLQLIQESSQQAHSETQQAQKTSSESINAVANLLQKSFDDQVTALKAYTLEILEKQQTGNQEHMQKLVEQHGDFVGELQQAVVNSDAHREILNGLAQTIEDERSDFREQMDQILRRNEETLRLLVGEQKKMLDISGMKKVEEQMEAFMHKNLEEFSSLLRSQGAFTNQFGHLGRQAERLGTMLTVLVGVASASIPVFAAIGIMFIFDLRPVDLTMRIVAMLAIISMIVTIAWFLRAKT